MVKIKYAGHLKSTKVIKMLVKEKLSCKIGHDVKFLLLQWTKVNEQWLQSFMSCTEGINESHVANLIHQDVFYFFTLTQQAEPDEPVILLTAPSGPQLSRCNWSYL